MLFRSSQYMQRMTRFPNPLQQIQMMQPQPPIPNYVMQQVGPQTQRPYMGHMPRAPQPRWTGPAQTIQPQRMGQVNPAMQMAGAPGGPQIRTQRPPAGAQGNVRPPARPIMGGQPNTAPVAQGQKLMSTVVQGPPGGQPKVPLTVSAHHRNPVAAQAASNVRFNTGVRNVGANMPGGGPMPMGSAPDEQLRIGSHEPITTSMLANANPQEQKQMLGERLYPLVHEMHAELAGKITGMLLEIDNAELLHMLESNESLKAKVDEAVTVLQAHQAKGNVAGNSAEAPSGDKK